MSAAAGTIRRYWTRRTQARIDRANAHQDRTAVLATLHPTPTPPISLVAISELTGIDLPHTQDAVTALLLSGHVALDVAPRPSTDHRRGGSVRYYLTPAGVRARDRRRA